MRNRRRPRGSGTIRKVGSTYAIRYGPRGRQDYESGFRTKLEAEQRLTIIRAEAMQRRHGIAADPRLAPPLADLADDWLKRRKATHAAGAEDASRWRKHLKPFFGHLRPMEVDTARLRAFLEAKGSELKPGTLRVVLSVLSGLYEDLLERGLARENPARHLPKSILRLVRSDADPRLTPFIERLDDVRRIFLRLPEPLNIAYAIGALAGLRTGEVFALQWRSVDLASRRILVSESVKGPTKDREPRHVPILDGLAEVLQPWRLRHPGAGLAIPPMRIDGKNIDKHTPGSYLRPILREFGFDRIAEHGKAWYCATRHTFASQWAMAGRPLRELQAILGHYSITETERYAHLIPGFFAPGVLTALQVSLAPGAAGVAHISAAAARNGRPTKRNYSGKTGAAL